MLGDKEWNMMSPVEKNRELFRQQKQTLDLFRERNAISKAQYDKSLGDLIEKMGIIIEDSREEKTFVFDSNDIEDFIQSTVKYIIRDIDIFCRRNTLVRLTSTGNKELEKEQCMISKC